MMKEVKQLKAGGSFGEMAIIQDKPRAATVYAKTNVIVATLKRDDYNRVIGDRFTAKIDQAIKSLRKFKILAELGD